MHSEWKCGVAERRILNLSEEMLLLWKENVELRVACSAKKVLSIHQTFCLDFDLSYKKGLQTVRT